MKTSQAHPEVSFRLARPGDGETLAALRQAAWASTYRGIYPDEMIDRFDYDWHIARNEAILTDPSYTTHLIELNAKPMGYLIWRTEQPPRYRDYGFCLQSLYLLPELQDCGVGRRAMALVKQACAAAGYDRLYWQCHPENAQAIAFYQHLGAAIIQRDENHEEKNMNTVYFAWRI